MRNVFGEPIEREGVTLMPAAAVIGGGGAGSGDGERQPDGTRPIGCGGGFGGIAWPAGAFELRDGTVRWHAALDKTRIALSAIFFGYLLLRVMLRAAATGSHLELELDLAGAEGDPPPGVRLDDEVAVVVDAGARPLSVRP